MCPKCASQPTGEKGHSELVEVFRSGATPDGRAEFVSFCCRECGDVWARWTYAHEYRWHRTESAISA